MADLAEAPLETERSVGDTDSIDATIQAAGGEREAIRALLIALAQAQAALKAASSLGYRRGRQPLRRAE